MTDNQEPAMKAKFLKKNGKFGEALSMFLREAQLDQETGWSQKVEIKKGGIEKRLGNGDSFARQGSSLRKYFIVRSFYANGIERIDDPVRGEYYERNGIHVSFAKPDRKIAIRLEGYARIDVTKPSAPKGTKSRMLEAGVPECCAWSGSTSALEIDHREGRPQKHGWTKGSDPDLYQFLTQHLNKVKRNACSKCVETGMRFNANLRLGTKIGFLEGDETYNPEGSGCKGCMLYDVRSFFESL